MKDRLYNVLWGLGIRVRSIVKRTRFLGWLEEAMLRIAPHLIPPPSRETEILLPSGMKIIIPPGFPSARSFAAGLYERDVVAVFADIIHEGMTVVVVGANVGYHPLLASSLVGLKGRVYAFEPEPRNYTYLVHNIEINKCTNVTAVPKAVSNTSGSAAFAVDRYGVEGHLCPPSSAGSLIIQTTTLDDFFAAEGWPNVDVMIMDIEGNEGAALEGMRELSRRNTRMQLMLESHVRIIHKNGGNVQAIAKVLMELGFCQGYIIERGLKLFSLNKAFPKSRATYDLLLEKGWSIVQ